MRHVLALSLGPVQDFIAAARKARDLYYGSHLLSETARAAARSLSVSGAELIFPANEALAGENVSIANKIVAILPDGLDPAETAKQAKDAANAYLTEQAGDALKMINRQYIYGEAYHAQIDCFLEWYAAWSPIEETATGYENARQKADHLLAGRKALRDFAQPQSTDKRPKSSLDGGRDTVLKERDKNAPPLPRIKNAEQLDAISLVKRMAPDNRAPSVSASRIAADPFIRRIRDTPHLRELMALAEQMHDDGDTAHLPPGKFPQFAAFPYDTQMFHLDKPDDEMDGEVAKAFIEQVAAIRKGLKISEVIPYFATLVADGDKMGRAIGNLKTPEEHRRLSQALNAFAQAAGVIVQEHQGALIYSGGDDVMAFLPLDKALACADKLRLEFKSALGGVVTTDTPTLSVGLSVAHARAPLDSLLRWGREAERLAKTERNALAVAFRPRSSGNANLSVCDSWQVDPKTQWSAVVGLLKDGEFAQGGAYKLRQLVDEAVKTPALAAALPSEIKRVLDRRRKSDGKTQITDLEMEKLIVQAGRTPQELETFVNRVLIARAFARAEKTADPNQEIADGSDVYSAAA